MFIEIAELKSVIYQYQLEEITEMDDDIVLMAINAATDQVKSYLMPNGKGIAPIYDVAVVFAATGSARSALLLEMTKNVAVFYIIRLCNVDMLYEQAKERYDRAISWLKDVRNGDTILDLPLVSLDINADAAQSFRSGSRTKFIHE